MSLRETVIQNHIWSDAIVHIVAHHYSRYVTILFKYILILVPLYRAFLVLKSRILSPWLSLICALWGIFLYCKIIINFLNYYLDAIILTDTEMIVFKREGILNYKTEHISLDSIEGISYTQYGLSDVLRDVWDIAVRLNHGVTIPFDSIPNPKQQIHNLMTLKEQYLSYVHNNDISDEINSVNKDKFEVLVETLSTMIIDHINKKEE